MTVSTSSAITVFVVDDHTLFRRGLMALIGQDAGLRQASPTSRVVMLTVSEDGQDLATALRNGAQGYLLKTMDGELLFEAIRRAKRRCCAKLPRARATRKLPGGSTLPKPR